jgi:hypothetical protein
MIWGSSPTVREGVVLSEPPASAGDLSLRLKRLGKNHGHPLTQVVLTNTAAIGVAECSGLGYNFTEWLFIQP